MKEKKQRIAIMGLTAILTTTIVSPSLTVMAETIKEKKEIQTETTELNSDIYKKENIEVNSISGDKYTKDIQDIQMLLETAEEENNYDEVDKFMNKYEISSNFIIDPNNIEASPFYNNEKYYSASSDEKAINIITLTAIAIRAGWKTGKILKFIKTGAKVVGSVGGSIAIGVASNVAYNGLPKVTPKTQYVGKGYYEAGWVVQTAQFALQSHGYNISADGYYGPATKDAIIKFQKSKGLAADGIIGNATWQALYK
ncbi:peptidoglycan-binding domain-containing protein [uncultured Clostridium sp.]|uniref:peptidoglycan-binding domain-containing protein n=1 Tax=uncultured Clostridium sp. TaxID=59620 RepID=UPI00260DFC7D|nr:peptidoglycan-binding domain-containing protein [uncultured Clostridium sp.]